MSDEDELRLNELHRFRKTSARLALEAHSHCEVPAGCGGVVLRWRRPEAPVGLSFFTYTTGKAAEFCLDGDALGEQRTTVSPGEHVLSFWIDEPGTQGFVLASANLDPQIVTARNPTVTSQADGRWRASTVAPRDGWRLKGFDDGEFVTLVAKDVPKPRDARKWSWEHLRELAQGLGLPENGAAGGLVKSWRSRLKRTNVERVWVRWTFSVDHRGFT
jgi:hypothetical protein